MKEHQETPLKRVTQVEENPKGQKDTKKVAAGRAGAAARKAKQERILVELRTAKESLDGRDVSGGATQQDDAGSMSKTPEPPVSLEAVSQQRAAGLGPLDHRSGHSYRYICMQCPMQAAGGFSFPQWYIKNGAG